LKEVFFFEIRFRLRQISTYLFAALLFALALFLITTDAVRSVGGDGHVHSNAPYIITFAGTIIMALGSIIASALMGTAIYRDFEANAHELFFTTRLTKWDYLLGRFLGAFVITVLVFCAIPLGFIAGSFAFWRESADFGPFRADVYLSFIFIHLIPNLFLVGTLFFVFGALTRSLLAIYTQGILLLVGWTIANQLLQSLENQKLAAFLDPFGLGASSLLTRYWTVSEKNHNLLPLEGPLLWNRLFWIGVGVVIFLIGYRLFAFSKNPLALVHRKAQEAAKTSTPVPVVSFPEHAVNVPNALSVFLRLTGFYFREIIRGLPFIIITLTGMLMMLVMASESEKLFGTPVYPVTRVMVTVISDSFGLFFVILITFYAGELTWRERILRLDQISDALPVPTAAMVMAKMASVLLMVVSLSVVLVFTGILMQAGSGYYHFELPLYLSYLFGAVLPSFVSMTLLAFFLHATINNKFLGHTGLILVFIISAVLPTLGLEHNLYLFGGSPELEYSDMNGYGPYGPPTFWFHLYWCAISTLLFLIAIRITVRGKEDKIVTRWRRGRLGPFGIVALVASGLAVVGAGGFIYYNTNILHEYVPQKTERHLRAKFERDYKATWGKRPMPRITDVSLDVDLHPEDRQYTVKGSYRLKNKTAKPIAEILLQTDPDLTVKNLTFSVAATPNITDLEYGFRTFRFARPLQPGETITLDFFLVYDKRGFANDSVETAIAGNGSFLTMPVPTIGYEKKLEIADEGDRRKEKLPPRAPMASRNDLVARGNTYIGHDADWISFEATVRTIPGQTAIAPGYLQKEWTENGRRCFHYKMDAPIRNFYSFLSARYAIKKDTWVSKSGKKVALEIYYHPAHTYNIARMMAGMKAALSYCSENYTPYQFHQLRILEFPVYLKLAQSFPNTISYSEAAGFIARVDEKAEDIDYPYYVTAHETAHQWWAHQVLGGDVEGSTMLSESLAEYTALKIMEKRYSPEQVRRFLRYDLDQYLEGRGSDRSGENPLVRVQNQQYIHYQKGALVFYALADRIGEAKLNAMLSQFAKQKGFQQPPYTTSQELLDLLKKGTPPSDQSFLKDLFEKITIYYLHVVDAKSEKLSNGKWRVTMTVYAAKRYADSIGQETVATIDDTFDIGVFAKPVKPGRDKEALGKPLVLRRVPLKKAETKFVFEVSEEPDVVGIDPYNKMIDRTPADNTMRVSSNTKL
jgi:ABC-2 type transport system permease protein